MIQPYSTEWEEVHRLHIDALLRQAKGSLKLKAGTLTISVAEGSGPVTARLGKAVVYEAHDSGAIITAYKSGPWVQQLVEKVRP
jgi:hypothetical protein